MYILLDNNTVKEFIPDINPTFPEIPIEKRYPTAFIERLVYVEEVMDIQEGYVYDPETGVFSPPPEPEYTEEAETEETETEPTAQDDIDAMLVDHEYRLTLLELGLTEEV